eukprot:TRINITY_DN2838_c0_g1_i1.p1 TRINITY_DN2838_c0_g1~~TRINITY_DN2838_c0_g1_i1.p1  ORF type:complete len:539 (+),score=162.50 TRINITY_DN2838_c0_g1_i1:52-1617(+)
MERNPNWLDVDEFDVIILGTGFAESVLSGAFSRIGKRVLHLDRAEFYGGNYATLSFDQINNFIKSDEVKDTGTAEQKQCENEITLTSGSSPFKNKQIVIPQDEREREETEELFPKKDSRRFNLDLTPKLMWSNSPNVDLLIRSGVARYLEFRCLEHTYLYQNNTLQLVPCSKSDIFSNKSISLLDKRTLMKFITQMTTPEELEKIRAEHSKEPFEQFLTSRLSVSLRAFVLYAISMIGSDQSVEANRVTVAEGIERFQRYLGSLGRYGNTPFLYSLNGTSELCQAYCRLSAVYGGLFVLRRTAAKLLLEKGDEDKPRVKSIIDTEGQELKTKHVITNLDHASNFIGPQAKKTRGTAICITNKSLTGDTLTLGVIPPNTFNNSHVIYLTQTEESAYTAPHGKYVVHLFGEDIDQAREALEPVVHSLFKLSDEPENYKPLLLWSAYFNQEIRSVAATDTPVNMHIITDPDFELDFEQSLQQVEALFKTICPGEEFIPTVPHPEDIIWSEEAEGEEENKADPLQ